MMITRVLLLAAAAASLGPMAVADAAPAPAERHCVVEVTGVRPTGELITTRPQCFGTRQAARDTQMSIASFTLGTHFDGFGFTGSSFSVVGDNCLGGYLNMDATWNNRVSSTIIGCPWVRHWDGYNATGAFQTLSTSGNLGSLNNKASSIQYLT